MRAITLSSLIASLCLADDGFLYPRDDGQAVWMSGSDVSVVYNVSYFYISLAIIVSFPMTDQNDTYEYILEDEENLGFSVFKVPYVSEITNSSDYKEYYLELLEIQDGSWTNEASLSGYVDIIEPGTAASASAFPTGSPLATASLDSAIPSVPTGNVSTITNTVINFLPTSSPPSHISDENAPDHGMMQSSVTGIALGIALGVPLIAAIATAIFLYLRWRPRDGIRDPSEGFGIALNPVTVALGDAEQRIEEHRIELDGNAAETKR